MKKVILVDLKDNIIGEATKSEAHEKGLLHSAFSVFLYNDNKLLIQQRALNKYHSGGKIANTCCSHPMPNIATKQCILDRLKEELNINIEDVKEIGNFIYHEKFAENLYEFEFDHIYISKYNGSFACNHEEVECAWWQDIDDIADDIIINPNKYAVWFFNSFKIFYDYIKINRY